MIDAHRVAERLWVGSYPGGKTLRHHFDVVILCASELQQADVDIDKLHAPFDDSSHLTRGTVEMLLGVAGHINKLRQAGKRILVTCQMGINRSAFLAAIALMLDGLTADEAVTLVREKRRPPAGWLPLSNATFVRTLVLLDRDLKKKRAGR
jgi:protein-tyrosine phosphatase